MPTRRAVDLEGLVDLIYRAALDTGFWPEVLAQAADLLGGSSAWLSELDIETGAGQGIIARIDPVMPVLYKDHYAVLNPFPARSVPRDPALARRRPGVVLASDLVDEAALVKSAYYDGFMRPQDVRSVLIIRLTAADGVTAAININRPDSWGPFPREALRRAEMVRTHFMRAFRLGKSMGGLAALPDGKPCLVVDAGCRVVRVNAKAEGVLARRANVLRLAQGVLGLCAAEDNVALRRAVGLAACGTGGVRQGGVVVSGGLILCVSPLGDGLTPVFAPAGLAIVAIDDLDTEAGDAQLLFMRALRLTPAESRVAHAFLMGAAPREIAVRLVVSHNTVRVHLAHIFAKTGVSRQADLARLLDRLVVAGGG